MIHGMNDGADRVPVAAGIGIDTVAFEDAANDVCFAVMFGNVTGAGAGGTGRGHWSELRPNANVLRFPVSTRGAKWERYF